MDTNEKFQMTVNKAYRFAGGGVQYMLIRGFNIIGQRNINMIIAIYISVFLFRTYRKIVKRCIAVFSF